MIEMSVYNYTMTQSSDNVDAIVADFEFSFGIFEKCSLVFKPALEYKGEECFVQIDESGSFIEGIVELHILNPLNPLIDAALVIAKATANLIFEIGQDFKIYGKVQ